MSTRCFAEPWRNSPTKRRLNNLWHSTSKNLFPYGVSDSKMKKWGARNKITHQHCCWIYGVVQSQSGSCVIKQGHSTNFGILFAEHKDVSVALLLPCFVFADEEFASAEGKSAGRKDRTSQIPFMQNIVCVTNSSKLKWRK